MPRPSKRDTAISEDLFAAHRVPSANRPDQNASVDEKETAQFLNPYAEASQALSPRSQPSPIDSAAPSRVKGVTDRGENSIDNREQRVSDNDKATAKLTEGATGASIKPWSTHANHASQNMLPRLMTAPEVASNLRVSVSTVWRLIKNKPGFPQPRRIDGSTRWDRLEVDRYLDDLFAIGETSR